MRRAIPLLLLLVLGLGHFVLLNQAARVRDTLPVDERFAAFVPGKLVKVSALEFDGVLSDFFFLRALVFIGSTYERQQTPRVADWEWEWLYNQLDVATELDPWFLDPYYVGQASLAIDGQRFDKSNLLLDKACRYRNWDWLPPFLAGFNRFYYQGDSASALPYLEAAARLPNASLIVKSLAARAAYNGNRTEAAILFLEEMIAQTDDVMTIKDLRKRLAGFRALYQLETAVQKYRAAAGGSPANLQELVRSGYIEAVPVDPYGGVFYLDRDGSVKTTSQFM